LDTINNMEDFRSTSPGGQQADGAASSSSNIEDYATTNTDDNRRETLPSPSTMERDQPRGSSLEHRNVSSHGASTSYLSAHDKDLAETSTSLPRNLPIRGLSKSALQIAQAQENMEPQDSTSMLSP
jgi:hypothetical protein